MQRRALGVLATAIWMSGAFAATAPHAAAATGAVSCLVSGTIDYAPPSIVFPPPSGNYVFNLTFLICVGANDSPLPPPAGAGTMTGVGTMTSSGQFGAIACGGFHINPNGSFCGSYNATNFTAGGECHGTVGGDELGSAFGGDWSLIVGPAMHGGITCHSGSYAGGWGAISLVAVPSPGRLGSQVVVSGSFFIESGV